jgi:regulator of RNase E activity RraB
VEIILSWDFQINQRNKIEEYDGFPYQLQISKTEFVDQQSIDHCTLQLSQLANQLNGEYDGWETVVIKNRQKSPILNTQNWAFIKLKFLITSRHY